MLKGIVINSTHAREGDLINALKTFGSKVDFQTISSDDKLLQLIDTRNIDMVIVPMKPASRQEIIDDAGPFINSMAESGRKIVPLKINNNLRYIDKERILFFEVMGRDSYIYTQKNKYVLYRQTLNHVLEEMNDKFIVRCHKSYAINLRNIVDICKERRGVWKPVFKFPVNGECLISETYYDDVIRGFEEWIVHTEKNG